MAQPRLSSWTDDQPLRLVAQSRPADDAAPKALACYGLLLREPDTPDQLWLRFVDGRPVSGVTTQFLEWGCRELARQGKTAVLLTWDNASWHLSHQVRDWLRAHNQEVKETGQGVRIVTCRLPSQSPWLNPIEPKWLHGKRQIVEPARLLTAEELAERVCAAFGVPHHSHLSAPKEVP